MIRGCSGACAQLDGYRKHISKRFVITGKAQRDEVWEYPLEAVREVVTNMIVHRDYRASGDSAIKIFDDRIEFFNPGALPPDLTLEDIISGKSPSVPRNKQIASIFKETGAIEKYGSGIKRILQTMSEVDAPQPTFEAFSGYFKVTLYPINKQPQQRSGGVNGGVNGGEEGVLRIIKQSPGIQTTAIKEQLSLSQRTVERRLKTLREKNLIIFRGPPKIGGYYPTEHDKNDTGE